MTRLPLTLAGLGLSAALAAGGVIVPVPRVPASALRPAPTPDDPATKPEDPATIADRITENTKKAGDKLAEFDAGDDTRKAQEQVLKDIDKLLNQPPMDGGGGGGGQQSRNNQNDQSQSDGMGPGGGQRPNPGGGMGHRGSAGGGGGQRKSGGSQSAGRQERQQRREQRQQAGTEQQPGGGQQTAQKNGRPEPVGGNDPTPAGPGGTENQQPGGAAGGQGGKGTPALPLDDAIAKQVWGHLPERLRQQMSQYYREQFMPKYGELLQEYYSSLAEREKARK